MLVLAMFAVAPLGLFASEMCRFYLTKQQLRAVIESGALAAASANASLNTSGDLTAAHTQAQLFASSIVQQNQILSYPLSGGTTSDAASASQTPGKNQLLLSYQWLDVYGNASATGKVLQLSGAWGYTPMFSAGFLPFKGPYTINESANGGLPMLDVILCFDFSSSMDDFTKVSLVNRYYDATSGKARYKILNTTADTTSNSPIYLYNGAGGGGETGDAVNGYYPQNIDSATNYGTFQSSYRGDAGVAPSHSDISTTNGWTDLVVNPDTSTFTVANSVAFTATNGKVFPAGVNGIYVAVEASRGNLETATLASSAGVDTNYLFGSAPTYGSWLSAYQSYACDANHAQPIGNAVQASLSFFNTMNNDCDAHFGIVSFSTNASNTYPSSVKENTLGDGNCITNGGTYYPDSHADYVGNSTPKAPTPGVNLQSAETSTNFSIVYPTSPTAACALSNPIITANGGTNIPAALNQAYAWLTGTDYLGSGANTTNNTRSNATRAIVLFTDGLPTEGGDNGTSDPNSQKIATQCGAKNIPIYCIGLCLTPGLQPAQATVLSATTGSSGIAALSGGQFFQVTSNNSAELNLAFQNVARSLVQLVQTQQF